MANFNTSREPMLMDEFIALAESGGWTLAATDPKQPRDEVNLVDAQGRMIVAYPQPTMFDPHVGFIGRTYGLIEVWQQGSLEIQVLEGQDPDEDISCTSELEALAAVLMYYDQPSRPGDKIREMLSEIGSRF